ncbi:MAG TPA: glycosyltransferase WbuB [Coriobacteriia bacterium]|nr:MAG: Glycosyl transferase group 1 [Actinobacteria bacterium 66_15]HAL29771.1 glycosyltransferase WbuB [Coriobacteriia bacterium]
MRVLFITMARLRNAAEPGIYSDLLREFIARGDQVFAVSPSEKREGLDTCQYDSVGVTICRVKTGNLQKVGLLEKAVSTLLVEQQFKRGIRQFVGSEKIDLVLYSTPPVTFDGVVKYVKQRYRCRSYLLLKDIFPQNAVDLGMMRHGGLVWRHFRKRERRLYHLADWIGCMSEANVHYLLENNPDLDPERVEVCPNSIEPREMTAVEPVATLRSRHGIPADAMVVLFGGNLGKPQGLDFLLDVVDRSRSRDDVHYVIAGSGTEKQRVWDHFAAGGHANVTLLDYLPKDQYEKLLCLADVGLILLDGRFTIPNFPSRLTAYMEAGMPVLAATDTVSDIKDVLRDSDSGLWVQWGDHEGFLAAIDRLRGNPSLRQAMGRRGRRYLEEHYTVAKAYETIMSHMTTPTGEGEEAHVRG